MLAVMKQLLLAAALLTFFIGCASSAPPTGFERALYTVTTNYVTNINQVAQINEEKVVTNSFLVTNVFVQFQLEPKQSTLDTVTTASSVATTAGVGWAGILGTVVAGLLYGWAEFRNRRKATLNSVLTNNVQVARETILATAGAGTELEYVDAIKSAQIKAGVKDLAAATVDSKVDEKEAREEAASVVSLGKRRIIVA